MKIKQSKFIISFGLVFSLVLIFYILFLQNQIHEEKLVIHIIFYFVLLIYLGRYFYLINFIKKRKVTFQLIEKQTNPILIDTYVGLFLFCILPIILALVNNKYNNELAWTNFTAFLTYFVGTLITLISESQRRIWKKENENKIFKDGLFKYANHINYFGETLSFPALCWLASGHIIIFLAVFIHQIVDFVYIQIPKQEKYLKNKYLEDFKKIRNKKKLIPFVY